MSSIKHQATIKLAEILSKDPVAIDKRQQIYYGLMELESADFKRINKEAGADSYSFFIAMLELFFGNKEPRMQINKVSTLLDTLGMGHASSLISRLNFNEAADAMANPGASEVVGLLVATGGNNDPKRGEPDGCFGNKKAVIPKYKITKNKNGFIGNALIVNFEKFNKGGNREGAQYDTPKLKSFCQEFHLFDTIKEDLTKVEFIETVGKFIDKFDENDSEKVCMVVILSHGEKGDSFLTKEGEKVSVYDELLPMFDNRQLKVKDKPKIFVLGFCRGANETFATDSVAGSGKKYDFKDMLCLFSTLPDRVAKRRKTDGTLFIDSFCKIIREHKKEELTTIFRLIEKDLEKIPGSIHSQQPTFQAHGFDHFYFKG